MRVYGRFIAAGRGLEVYMVRDDKPWQPTPEQAAEIERWDKQVAAHCIENERLIGVVQELERSLESERAARARLHDGLTQAIQLAASGALVKDHDPPTRTTHVWEETIESWRQALADRSPLEWLAARDEKIRAECSAIATFYVPGETQSTEADAAPNLRCAWEWGAAHAASRIGAVLGGASADDTSARMQDGPTTAQTDDDALWPPPDRTTPGARNSPEAYMAAHPPDTTLDAAIDEIHELRTKVAHLEEVLRAVETHLVDSELAPLSSLGQIEKAVAAALASPTSTTEWLRGKLDAATKPLHVEIERLSRQPRIEASELLKRAMRAGFHLNETLNPWGTGDDDRLEQGKP